MIGRIWPMLVVLGVMGTAAYLVYMVGSGAMANGQCPVRHIAANTIKPDLTGRDAAVLAMAMSWRTACWEKLPTWARQVLLDNTAEGPPP